MSLKLAAKEFYTSKISVKGYMSYLSRAKTSEIDDGEFHDVVAREYKRFLAIEQNDPEYVYAKS